jgi:hypothetical protein
MASNWASRLALPVGFCVGLLASLSLGARNSSGTYSLPAGNPVVSGTAVNSTVHNNTTSDIATELTDSLSRSGKGAMTAPLELANGTVALPALSFDSDTDCGLYRVGANNIALGVNGAKVVDILTTGATVTGAMTSTTAAVTGNATVGGTLDVTGDFTAAGIAGTGANIEGQLEVDEVWVTASDPATGTGYSDTLTTKNIPKAWGLVTGNGGSAAAITNGFNITNIQEAGNTLTVDFVTDFGANPACIVNIASSDINIVASATTATITLAGLTIPTDLDTNLASNSSAISFVCFGAN